MKLNREIQSLIDFKHNIPVLVQYLRTSGEPIILTVNGTADLMMKDAESYQKLLDLAN